MEANFQKIIEDLGQSVVIDTSMVELGVMLLVGGILSLYLGFLYRMCSATASDPSSITRIFPLLTLITTGVILVVKSSLTLSLGLVGALSIVRFRSAIKEPEELVYLFLCIAIGLSLGASQPLLAVALVAAVSLFAFGLKAVTGSRSQQVMLTVTGDSDRYFQSADTSAIQTVEKVAGSCTIHRVDLENGRGQLRVLLRRTSSKELNSIVIQLRKAMPECEFSFVDVKSVI
ncbi:MAG: DUF4956 domain-containing protein [Pirellulaceae bacterium]|nr:DUF4956 domain-containing protein [Pirellulaceae bacterium]MDP7018318.1 DUF4956 domain-containing protein [Pirellulaceae bacterium]